MSEWTGELRLEMSGKQGKTVPSSVYFRGALKVMRPLYLDNSGQACYIVINPGGGYVDQDKYKMDVVLKDGSELLLTTQAATKVYRTPTKTVYQENFFELHDDSLLEYKPEPLIAYRDASYYQKSVIRMSTKAMLLYEDMITPGWSDNDQLFPYRNIRMKTEIYVDGKLVVLDHLSLIPKMQYMKNTGFLEGYTHLGTLFMINKKVENKTEELMEILDRYHETCRIGFSRLNTQGVIVRVFGNETKDIKTVFHDCTVWLKKLLNRGSIDLRKY
ncbi:urease accessory protein UreD [Sporolactobacillus sp. Y61]|uniref:Urease accessory protein UreD n=1 Tax=Sporolactobacillus sp. Y61 TaxID=3160863 RepID=A0AAU8IG01_9BACL